ncbi:hypothetical protein Tco_0575432 [Tanacetum coccineum]
MISSLLVVRRNKQEELFTHKEEMAPMALSDSKAELERFLNKEKEGLSLKFAKFCLEEFKKLEVIKYGPRDSSLKSTTGSDKKSENSKENTNDSLEQHQMTDTETSSFESPLKVDKDWKEKFFYPANHVEFVNKIEKPVRKNNDAPIIEDWVSDDEDEVETTVVVKKKTVVPTAAKIEKPVRNPVKPVWNNSKRVNHYYSTRITHPNSKRNFVPKAVLMKTGMRPVNATKPKAAYNAVKRNRFNDVKASACWVWMPKNRVIYHVSKNISASVTLKRLDYIDAQGRFKWMHRLRGGKSATKKKKNLEKSAAKAEREDCWELNTSELVLPMDELVLLSHQLVYTARVITAVGEKVNAAESLLVVSTEVNAN